MPKWCVHVVGVNMRKQVDKPMISIMRCAVLVLSPPRANHHRVRPMHSKSTNMGKRRASEPSTVCSNSTE